MILEAKELCFSYRKRDRQDILKNFSLTLHPGERVGLSAPSGMGKTTLCRLLAGYERPDRGQILLDGKPISFYRGFCPVQMIWQHPELAVDPLLPLGKTLCEAGPIDERILTDLHIDPSWFARYPSELSGGELQRFCIARALRPRLQFLLCDEITAMLDLITQAQIWQLLLEESKNRSFGMLVVSHHKELLKKVCTRIEPLS